MNPNLDNLNRPSSFSATELPDRGRRTSTILFAAALAASLVACDRKATVTEAPRAPEAPAAMTPAIQPASNPTAMTAAATPIPATPAPTPAALKPMVPAYTGTQDQWKARMSVATPEARVEILGEALATGDDEASWVYATAMTDSAPAVRQAAVNELSRLSDPNYQKFAPAALKDAVPEIRQAAIDQLGGRAPETQAPVLAAAMASDFPEVREAALERLTTQPNATLLEVLFAGLDDPDEAFRTQVREQVQHLVRKEFGSYDEAAAWWKANRVNYNSELVYLGD